MRELAGRYRVGQAVGRGGSAMVHRGFDRTLKRRVAIKLFFSYGPYADDSAADVLREARTAAGINHPNIARVYDFGEVIEDGERTPYLIMEFLDGETLADRLARTGALEWRRAAEICADTAAALAAAHEQNLVHRDVKPRNVMLTPDEVKVLDFGIAAAAGSNSVDTNGRLWGTPAHLAPEQLRGEATFPAADVYALGLLLFECLTGTRAWPGKTVGEILAARHGRPAPRLPRIPGLPREIIRLYEACTVDDPHQRPSAAAAAETLRSVASPAILTLAIPPVRPARSRSRRRATLMASVGVATAVLSVLGMQLANGAATPGGHRADAAAGEPPPAGTSPTPSSTPATSPTKPAAQATAIVPVTVRTSTPATGTATRPATATPTPSVTPSHSAPSSEPPASPSSPPATSPDPDQSTPSQTPDSDPPPTDPDDHTTDPGPSPTPDDTTPPVTTDPGAPLE
jgi:serine/threonine protein kinase